MRTMIVQTLKNNSNIDCIEGVRRDICKYVQTTKDYSLLDLIYKLLLAECDK